jgi:hypothetical protein
VGGQYQARHRELLVVFTQPPGVAGAAGAVARQAEQATALLAGAAGVTLTPLDADATGRVLAAATSPASPPRPAGLAPAGRVITGRQP